MKKNKHFDVAIIGGGTVGSMIFLDCTLRGLSAILIEAGEIGMQTNRASLGLFQAGLNYLHKDRDLVQMNAVDCKLMKKIAGNLLKRQQFIIPIFPDSRYPLWLWDGYLTAYDKFNRESHPKHLMLSSQKIASREPFLKKNLKGGIVFNEWVVDPTLLTKKIAGAGQISGGTILQNAKVVSATYDQNNDNKNIKYIEVLGGDKNTRRISASMFVNAAGPWAPQILKNVFALAPFDTRMTKGTSIIVKKQLSQKAIIVFDDSHKYISILPLEGNLTLIGPTNIDVDKSVTENPDLLRYSEEEIDRLISISRKYFNAEIKKQDISDIRCGLRPQLAHHHVRPNSISHEFMIIDHEKRDGITNLVTEFGGKLSNQIRMAKEAVDLVCQKIDKGSPWILPSISILGNGSLQKNHHTDEEFYSLYEKKYALSYKDNIGKVALFRKIDAISHLMPLVGMSLIKMMGASNHNHESKEMFMEELLKIFGKDNVITDKEKMRIYSFDKCPGNILEKSKERIGLATIRPSKEHYHSELYKLITLAKKYQKKIVARGGGSGVCGAAVPRNGSESVIVDMTSLDAVSINQGLRYVDVGSGIIGSTLEGMLNKEGFTLGHSPASLGISTPGGWVATHSNGQFSSRFGSIEDLTLGIETIDASGKIKLLEKEELMSFFRMEGTTGLITKVRLRIFPMEKHLTFAAYYFSDLENAIKAMRKITDQRPELERVGVWIKSLRLYDFIDRSFIAKPHKAEGTKKGESRLNILKEKILLSNPPLVNTLLNKLQRLQLSKSLMIVVLSSDNEEEIRNSWRLIDKMVKSYDGTEDKNKIAEIWYKNRYKLNYEKLESKFSQGIIADTFDCRVKSFDDALKVYEAVKKSVKDTAIMGAHFGIDRESPYIYFTFAGAGNIDFYKATWQKILKACYKNGGLITHHHGIGSLKAGDNNTLAKYCYGEEWLKSATETKKRLDPDNIFNPGNIF